MDKHVKEKHKYDTNFIDKKVREVLHNNRVTASVIAYLHSFNHCRVRDAITNKNLKENECPWCSLLETWEHIVQCKKTKHFRWDFVKELASELLKEKIKK